MIVRQSDLMLNQTVCELGSNEVFFISYMVKVLKSAQETGSSFCLVVNVKKQCSSLEYS